MILVHVSPPPSPLLGVHSVLVALLAEKADIQYDSELTDPDKLVAEIVSLGFGANLLSDGEGYQQGKVELIVSTSPCCVHGWCALHCQQCTCTCIHFVCISHVHMWAYCVMLFLKLLDHWLSWNSCLGMVSVTIQV